MFENLSSVTSLMRLSMHIILLAFEQRLLFINLFYINNVYSLNTKRHVSRLLNDCFPLRPLKLNVDHTL